MVRRALFLRPTYRLIKGGVQGRVDDITKVKGVLLSPRAIEDVVRGFPELGDEYEVVVDRRGDSDSIVLKIEFLPDAGVDQADLMPRLKNELRVKTNLGYVVEVHPYGSLPRYEGKGRRFKDRRDGH